MAMVIVTGAELHVDCEAAPAAGQPAALAPLPQPYHLPLVHAHALLQHLRARFSLALLEECNSDAANDRAAHGLDPALHVRQRIRQRARELQPEAAGDMALSTNDSRR